MTFSFKKLFLSNLFKNGLWLYLLQIFNLIIPLLTIPYITRTLGPEQYGVFSIGLNIVTYLTVVVQFGFHLTGTRKVTIAKDDNEVASIYSNILTARILLLVASFLLLVILMVLMNFDLSQNLVIFTLYLMAVGTALQQTWLFHGLQKMKHIALISVFAKSVSLILIFLLVNNSGQVILYSFLYAITFLLLGILSIFIIEFKLKIHYKIPPFKKVYLELKDGWDLFTTSAMSKVFGGIGITILIFTSTELNVGIYSAYQKIPLTIIMLFSPIGQVVFPYISKAYEKSFFQGINKLRKIFKFILPLLILGSITLVLFSEKVIYLAFGEDYVGYSLLLLPLIFWMTFSIINNMLGIQILVASGYSANYKTAFRIGIFAIITFNLIFGFLGGIYGIALAALLAEITLTIALIIQIVNVKNLESNKNRLLVLKNQL